MTQKKAPGATILMGITPRTDSHDGASVMATIDAINARYATLTDARSRIRYLNINRVLAKADGAPREGMTVDGLHLSVTGYQIWADALTPILTEIRASRRDRPRPAADG